ncbi:MAG: histidine phosphatase family protein [SAR202 cluster bacterium]|nr:histidine phosphatase family protein [SAR202 cluster bacterium]
MQIILVRHGETMANKAQLVLGTSDVPLTELGRGQAKAAAQKISLMEPSPTILFSSPYQRAKETAGYISNVIGLNPIFIDGLKEMNSGEMEGIKASKMVDKYPEYMKNWRRDHSTARPPGGETLEEVHSRAWKSILNIFNEYDEPLVVVVAHLFPIQGILCNVLGIKSNNFEKLVIDLGSLSSIEIQSHSYRLLRMNDICPIN